MPDAGTGSYVESCARVFEDDRRGENHDAPSSYRSMSALRRASSSLEGRSDAMSRPSSGRYRKPVCFVVRDVSFAPLRSRMRIVVKTLLYAKGGGGSAAVNSHQPQFGLRRRRRQWGKAHRPQRRASPGRVSAASRRLHPGHLPHTLVGYVGAEIEEKVAGDVGTGLLLGLRFTQLG